MGLPLKEVAELNILTRILSLVTMIPLAVEWWVAKKAINYLSVSLCIKFCSLSLKRGDAMAYNYYTLAELSRPIMRVLCYDIL